MNKIKIFGILVLASLAAVSCKDALNQMPNTEIVEGVYDVASAEAAMIGVYNVLQSTSLYGTNMSIFGDLRGGDMRPTSSSSSRTTGHYEFNNRTPDNGPGGSFWSLSYSALNRVNSIITAYNNEMVTDGTEAARNDILGQALAMRAFHHFDIVRLFGVPYLKDNGASWGAVIADRVIPAGERPLRATVAETYQFIIDDLTAAIDLLTPFNASAIADKYPYMNYWAAKSLLARVALYKGDWDLAFSNASDVIENGPYELIPGAEWAASWKEIYTDESIFSVVNTTTDNGDRESLSSVSLPTSYGEISIGSNMIDILRESGDDVRATLIGINLIDQEGWYAKYPGQGSMFTNNIPLIRLSDVYLMAAEAALKKSSRDQTSADKYLNAIRKRASASATDVVATIDLVRLERRKELVHEGFRFFDIMRTGETVVRNAESDFLKAEDTPTVTWDDYITVLPIPRVELNGNPDIQQNPGY
jgi:hypothetical protein